MAARRLRRPPWPDGAGSAVAVGVGAAAVGGGDCECARAPGAQGDWGGDARPRAARTGSMASLGHSRYWSARPRTGTYNVGIRHQDK